MATTTATPTTTATDVFQFMSVRSPESIEPQRLRHFYIQDQYISPTDGKSQENSTRNLRDIFAMNSESIVGRTLYKKIFCENDDRDINTKNGDILQVILRTLNSKSISCEEGFPDSLINELEQVPYIRPASEFYLYINNEYFLLPVKLETIVCNFDIKKLLAAKKLIKKHTREFNHVALLKGLKDIFRVTVLADVVYENGVYAPNYQELRNILFETLYKLHILRRLTSINLEHIIAGLQTLHTLEILAADDFLNGVRTGQINPNNPSDQNKIKLLKHLFEEIEDLDLTEKTNTFFFVKDEKDLSEYFQSLPIIHPIIARLHWYTTPFNKSVKPIGLGDLIVVKQQLLGYKAGEISHVHNIMKGELKERNHRHLEKTEEVFSFSSENNQETQTENQTTGRFEVKKEAEKVVKADLNISAQTNFTYNGGTIIANVGGSFAYTNSSQDTQRSASNYARDVMDKAVTQIQNRTTEQRSTTKIYETEETNKHIFDNNKVGAAHTSGIYRWLDKKYKSQLYNFGKRWMFEFIIPEPAAFYVISKLKAAEFDINAPEKLEKPEYDTVEIFHPVQADAYLFPRDLDEPTFNQMKLKYDLSEYEYPVTTKKIMCINSQTGESVFQKSYGSSRDQKWSSEHYEFQFEDKGFSVISINVMGQARFWDQIAENTNYVFEKNFFSLYINGQLINERKEFDSNPAGITELFDQLKATDSIDISYALAENERIDVSDSKISIDLGFQDLDYYQLSILLTLEMNERYLNNWRTKVYNKIVSIEQKRIDKIDQEKEIAYNAAMADYRNDLRELNAQTVNDIIQGRSEAFNREIIRDELKKHCITMLAKEFDADNSDDILSQPKDDAIEDKDVTITYDKFSLEKEDPKTKETVPVIGFNSEEKVVKYPKINIDRSKKKEKFIQFLEQAFEWQNIAYLFYPYFWAAESKWIKLMNRLDYTDNNMTAFLKAGSVRILLAVTPNYENAVQHFLDTREPWEGGPLPVIGDPLFIPVYEEIRKQQDNLQDATPFGNPWFFEVPTSLVYLQDSSSPIPTDLAVPPPPPDPPAPTP